jgi:hypothetical protein
LVQNDKYGSKILECDPPKEVTGNGQQVDKMQRLQERQVYSKKNRK